MAHLALWNGHISDVDVDAIVSPTTGAEGLAGEAAGAPAAGGHP